jgi:D-lactate dehydrogenase
MSTNRRRSFFKDRSEEILQDDQIARLMSFNVLITAHQAFLQGYGTDRLVTLQNLADFEADKPPQ